MNVFKLSYMFKSNVLKLIRVISTNSCTNFFICHDIQLILKQLKVSQHDDTPVPMSFVENNKIIIEIRSE